jgi:peptidoglycan/xylan/chitin deacetylase (PgdA/CDA1 family)
MLGIVTRDQDRELVAELFEFFKTPWEFHRQGGRYSAVICTEGVQDIPFGAVTVVYGSNEIGWDRSAETGAGRRRKAPRLVEGERRFKLSGWCMNFERCQGDFLRAENGDFAAAGGRHEMSGGFVVRFGYDLIEEVRVLLSQGQASEEAGTAALDCHVAVLRRALIRAGVPLVEIPAIPEGYNLIAGLSHDVDDPRIELHGLDHTVLGFLGRALFGSVGRAIRGRMSWGGVWQNWVAALKLPLARLGLAADFWLTFDRYIQLERGDSSTFFVLPFKNRPGVDVNGHVAPMRASVYGAEDIASSLASVRAAGHEVGLHGIDAWRDAESGRVERGKVSEHLGTGERGVRMHWLYFDHGSFARLEEAGFTYDSTVGYNETTGFKAGTAQAYRPPGAQNLLELPLIVMDTALFYPSYLNLTASEALGRVRHIIEQIKAGGGVLTINWHDRSLAPERLWDTSYADLLRLCRSEGAWVTSLGKAVQWFRKRRSAVFETSLANDGRTRVRVAAEGGDDLPGLRLRVYEGSRGACKGGQETELGFRDFALHKNTEVLIGGSREMKPGETNATIAAIAL